jgi:hypothetical protein
LITIGTVIESVTMIKMLAASNSTIPFIDFICLILLRRTAGMGYPEPAVS